jgi:hypothetical protein
MHTRADRKRVEREEDRNAIFAHEGSQGNEEGGGGRWAGDGTPIDPAGENASDRKVGLLGDQTLPEEGARLVGEFPHGRLRVRRAVR